MNARKGDRTAHKTAENLLRQTQQIWEQKAVGLIYDHYLHKVKVHTALGERYGRDATVADTVQQLAAFPNLRLRGESVIWNHEGYISHRATHVAYNTGYSDFGQPTGNRVCYPVATDFRVFEGRVVEVWEARDRLLLAKQLGFGIHEAVVRLANRRADTITLPRTHTDAQLPPDAPPRPPIDEAETFVRWVWHEIWNRRRFDRIAEFYAPNYRYVGPSGRRFHTNDGYASYALSLLAAFPDATMLLEHVMSDAEYGNGRAAVRWRFTGTHDGPGYGVPTGRSIRIPGITHLWFKGGRFTEERTVFDELALWVQLHRANVTN